MLIIGVGSIGERHLRCFGNTGRAEMSICETNETLRTKIAGQYSVQQAYANLDEAIADPPDAAVICTPAHLHISMAIQLAEAGVDLLIEKPLSVNLEGIEPLQKLVEQKQLTTAVAYVQRMNPIIAEIRTEIQSGRFGKPVQLTAVCGQHFPFYRPAYRETYYTSRATGGGAIQDALTHLVNAGEWLIGPITQLAADAAHQVLEGVEVEDTVHVISRHGSVQGCYSLNQHQAPNEFTLTIVCERGTARVELHKNRWRWQTEPDGDWHDEPHKPLERDELFVRQAEMFLNALETGSDVACTIEEGLQTLRVNLAILRSTEQRTFEDVRP